MKTRLITLMAVLALFASYAVILSPRAALADPDKAPELLKRIEQLEKRVAELEQVIKERLPSGQPPPAETEKKLVGNWVIAENDKKTAAEKRLELLTDLNMKADGTCDVVREGFKPPRGSKYRVTVIVIVTETTVRGATQITIRGEDPNFAKTEVSWQLRIGSATETELVLEYPSGDDWVKMHYTRKK
jgi:hypothetical protein